MKEKSENDDVNFLENQGINYKKGWEDEKFSTQAPKRKKKHKMRHHDKSYRDEDSRGKTKKNVEEGEDVKYKYFNRLMRRLHKYHDQGYSAIISAEQFCFNDRLLPDDPLIWDLFLPPLEVFDVHVVLTYRRYYEWITSYYFQFNVMRTFPHRKQTLAEFVQIILDQYNDLEMEGRQIETHPTYHVYSKFKKHFENIYMINLHEDTGEDIVTKFVCNAIPDAVHTCSKLASSQQGTHELRKSRELDFDLIVQGAIDKKLLQKISSSKDFKLASNDASDFYQSNNNNPLPYRCLPEEVTELIFSMSQSFEEELVPDFYQNPENQKLHREGFMKAVTNKKFCDVDIENVLNDKKWKKYFREYDAKFQESNDNIDDPYEMMRNFRDGEDEDRREIYSKLIEKRRREKREAREAKRVIHTLN